MKRATGRAVAAATSVLCATALAGVLAGCRAQSVASQPAGSVTSTAGVGAVPAGAPDGTTPAGAGVDSDLSAVDGQLSGLDSALAQATQSPSDGG
ncbi:hypothetical protein KGA66_00015 [Actinocrinis puniceicyclus]|uniref:Lipoprotein n=1 Tax=Actinocrinis puniceicyclus TaxID=977794 RepID=A0A8J7WJR1_9ACTN|nr:hypothetical protein [Actinocrinis puniceicyclus]MBS2961407.1 hypothetical protein [Actinocrinis puniceicyclus]